MTVGHMHCAKSNHLHGTLVLCSAWAHFALRHRVATVGKLQVRRSPFQLYPRAKMGPVIPLIRPTGPDREVCGASRLSTAPIRTVGVLRSLTGCKHAQILCLLQLTSGCLSEVELPGACRWTATLEDTLPPWQTSSWSCIARVAGAPYLANACIDFMCVWQGMVAACVDCYAFCLPRTIMLPFSPWQCEPGCWVGWEY